MSLSVDRIQKLSPSLDIEFGNEFTVQEMGSSKNNDGIDAVNEKKSSK